MSNRRSTQRVNRSRGGVRQSRKHGGLEWDALLKLALGVLVVGALGYWMVTEKARQDATDPVSFCNRSGPSEIHVVLLDASDMMDDVQIERVKAAIFRAAKGSSTGTRFDIYIANTPDGRLADPVFSKCNPGEPGKYAAINSDANAKREAFEKTFLAAIEETLSGLLTVNPASTSPIIESIRSSATRSLARVDQGTLVRMTIVSDMVQNSSMLRHQSANMDFRDFKEGASWPQALADLHDARVDLIYIARSHYRSIQGRSHQAWWEAYFNAIHGRLIGIDTI